MENGLNVVRRRVHKSKTSRPSSNSIRPATSPDSPAPTRYFAKGNLTLVWDTIKSDVMQQISATSQKSNIGPTDYVGPDRCKECHPANYDDWSRHPHRWMNALAMESTILGDFLVMQPFSIKVVWADSSVMATVF